MSARILRWLGGVWRQTGEHREDSTGKDAKAPRHHRWWPLVGGLAASAFVGALGERPPLILEIDVDHGLEDCPWRTRLANPNVQPGTSDAFDPRDPLTTDINDVFLVLRDRAHVALAEPVESVACRRPDNDPHPVLAFGGEIDVSVKDVPRTTDTDVPPAVIQWGTNRQIPHGRDAVKVYRYALRLIDAFDLDSCNGTGRSTLDASFSRRDVRSGLDLRGLGRAAVMSIALEPGYGSESHHLRITFPRTRDTPKSVCQPASVEMSASDLPLCPPADGHAWNWGPPPARRCPWEITPGRDTFE